MPRGVYPRKGKPAPEPSAEKCELEIHFIHEEGMGRYRVWNPNWFSDMFETLSPEEFRLVSSICRRLGIHMKEVHD